MICNESRINGGPVYDNKDTLNKRRKVYPDNSRNVTLFTVTSRHPLNVKPEGNSLLLSENDYDTKRYLPENAQMGKFFNFPDELIMEILSYVDDIESLKNFSHTSRIMYAFLYDEEIWKKLYIKESLKYEKEGKSIDLKWRSSWRCTMLRLDEKYQANLQIPGNLLCSDILYRPFQCSQVNYDKIFNKIIKEQELYHLDSINNRLGNLPAGRIQRLQEDSITLLDFNERWHDKPFILTNPKKDRWPNWDLSSLLERFSDVKFRQEAVQWNLSLYSQYFSNNRDESPLYLFDCNSIAMKTLRNEYSPPEIFQYDLFTVFEDDSFNCRPDHAWLIVGPERSGSTFHKDPNYTSAWNVALTGRKLWIMLPPNITPPGVGTDDDESEVTSPVGIAEWVISGFFNDCLKIDECLIGVTFPGECMYVPSGWWHSVINLDNSVALTQNFVPLPKLPNALNFFKNKKDQISGFHPNQVKDALDNIISIYKEDKEAIKNLKEYSEKFESSKLESHLQTEDCGEILSSQLPPMPIFELFKQLLIKNNKQDELNVALDILYKLERSENRKNGKNEKWEKLVTNDIGTSTFSFGFALDESSDEEI